MPTPQRRPHPTQHRTRQPHVATSKFSLSPRRCRLFQFDQLSPPPSRLKIAPHTVNAIRLFFLLQPRPILPGVTRSHLVSCGPLKLFIAFRPASPKRHRHICFSSPPLRHLSLTGLRAPRYAQRRLRLRLTFLPRPPPVIIETPSNTFPIFYFLTKRWPLTFIIPARAIASCD